MGEMNELESAQLAIAIFEKGHAMVHESLLFTDRHRLVILPLLPDEHGQPEGSGPHTADYSYFSVQPLSHFTLCYFLD